METNEEYRRINESIIVNMLIESLVKGKGRDPLIWIELEIVSFRCIYILFVLIRKKLMKLM